VFLPRPERRERKVNFNRRPEHFRVVMRFIHRFDLTRESCADFHYWGHGFWVCMQWALVRYILSMKEAGEDMSMWYVSRFEIVRLAEGSQTKEQLVRIFHEKRYRANRVLRSPTEVKKATHNDRNRTTVYRTFELPWMAAERETGAEHLAHIEKGIARESVLDPVKQKYHGSPEFMMNSGYTHQELLKEGLY